MTGLRIALLGDVHANVAALEAALAEIGRHKPDVIAVLGDHVLNGPRPAETVDAIRDLAASGALVISGNTDIAVADGDFAAAFPWLDEVPVSHRNAADWARDQLSEEHLGFLRSLPAERRLAFDGELLLLACHASPGSQTAGMPVELDAATTMQYATRTDARVIGCGHTHVADLRELGRKLLLNPGSCGYAFDGSPEACWALLTASGGAEPQAQLFRTAYDAQSVAEEVSSRGLPADVYRAATIRTGRFVR